MKTLRVLYTGLAIAMLAAVWNRVAYAQEVTITPYYSNAGIATAEVSAKNKLGNDAHLAFIGAQGNSVSTSSGFTVKLLFYPETGKASSWAYLFYSPSKQEKVLLAVADIPGMGPMVIDVADAVPIPAQVTSTLDLSLPYAASSQMIVALKSNSTYNTYRADYPDALPKTISLREIISTDSLLPASFPINGPVWVLMFNGAGDSTMICYVSARTGQTFCWRASAVASVPGNSSNYAGVTMRVLSGSSARTARITATPRAGKRTGETIDIALYNAAGERVEVPVEISDSGREWIIELNLEGVPAGAYYCNVAGQGWSGSVGVMR